MIWLLASMAFAEPCTEAAPVQVGDTVACEGILLPTEQVRALILVRDVELPEAKAEFSLQSKLVQTQLDGLKRQLEIEHKTLGLYRDLLDNPPRARLAWFEHPAFWGAVGVAAGVGVGVSLAVR